MHTDLREQFDANFHNTMSEVEKERRYQIDRWGIADDLSRNTPNDFVAYISHYSSRWFKGGFPPYGADEIEHYRNDMIKVATLALTAAAAVATQRQTHDHCFFEVEDNA